MMRLGLAFLGLALLVIVPFLIWGGGFEAALAPRAAIEWLKGYGASAWAAGIAASSCAYNRAVQLDHCRI